MLSLEQKTEIRKNLLTHLNEIITTANEREILKKYESEYGIIALGEEIAIENRLKQNIKETEEKVILF